PPLPQLTEAQYSAFLRDAGRQQFWKEAQVKTDGVSGPTLTPLGDVMNAKNWHFHPIGFLAQMRECLSTDVALSEESFEVELRNNWAIGLKLIEKRLKQLEPWSDPHKPLPAAPTQLVVPVREYATLGTIWNWRHSTLWENFIYWFGVDPNTITTPVVSTTYTTRSAAPAGHHVYCYMKGMRNAFRHVSTQHIVKGSLGFEAGAWVWQNRYPEKPLVPAEKGFKMECINIACQHGLFFKRFQRTEPVGQNRMQLQLHELSHMVGTTCSDDQTISLPDGQRDPNQYNGTRAYGAEGARVLAEFQPERALANAENVSLFILSGKDEPN
ncbi:hypothetical protein, partial [Caballeronia grimmiae]|uniref:hypothetical protein n=1 Tax=Caballeronia grimmiae TaxID=1071679 RepID=UPI0038BA9B10